MERKRVLEEYRSPAILQVGQVRNVPICELDPVELENLVCFLVRHPEQAMNLKQMTKKSVQQEKN